MNPGLKINVFRLNRPSPEDDLSNVNLPYYVTELYETEDGVDADVYPIEGGGIFFKNAISFFNKRIVAQGGLFTYIIPDSSLTELPKTEKYDLLHFASLANQYKVLTRYTIRFENFEDITKFRRFLGRAGITAKTLFPDLDGVVKDCKWRIKNFDFSCCPTPLTERDRKQKKAIRKRCCA